MPNTGNCMKWFSLGKKEIVSGDFPCKIQEIGLRKFSFQNTKNKAMYYSFQNIEKMLLVIFLGKYKKLCVYP